MCSYISCLSTEIVPSATHSISVDFNDVKTLNFMSIYVEIPYFDVHSLLALINIHELL